MAMTEIQDDVGEDLAEAEDITDPDVPPLAVFEEQVSAQDLAEVDADQLELNYHGEKRTVTGVVKIMRREGDEESADLLEHLAQLGQGVKKLADAVQQKRITGLHARPVLKKDGLKKP
jgi:hypothetical protein